MATNEITTAAQQKIIPIACTLSEEQLTERKDGALATLMAQCEQTEELDDGYALRFPGSAEIVSELAQFIAFERDCCAFYTFELICEAEQGPVTLRVRGPARVKEFVRGMVSVDKPVAQGRPERKNPQLRDST